MSYCQSRGPHAGQTAGKAASKRRKPPNTEQWDCLITTAILLDFGSNCLIPIFRDHRKKKSRGDVITHHLYTIVVEQLNEYNVLKCCYSEFHDKTIISQLQLNIVEHIRGYYT